MNSGGAGQKRAHCFVDLGRRCGVERRAKVDVEVDLTNGLAGRFDQQVEQLQDFFFAVERAFDVLAKDVLELFAFFKERRSVLRLDFQQEALIAGVADQRGAFVAIGDEFARGLPADALVAGLEVDFHVLFGTGFAVVVVVVLVNHHVHAAHFVDGVFELGEVRDEDMVDGKPEHALDRLQHQLHSAGCAAAVLPAVRVGGVDAIFFDFAVGLVDRHLQLARDRKHGDRRLARIDAHEQHLVRVRQYGVVVVLCQRAFVIADQQQGLGGTAGGGGEDARCDFDRFVLVKRRDEPADLVARHQRGRDGADQHDCERAQQEAPGDPPAAPRRLGGRWCAGCRHAAGRWRRRRREGRGRNRTHGLAGQWSQSARPAAPAPCASPRKVRDTRYSGADNGLE